MTKIQIIKRKKGICLNIPNIITIDTEKSMAVYKKRLKKKNYVLSHNDTDRLFDLANPYVEIFGVLWKAGNLHDPEFLAMGLSYICIFFKRMYEGFQKINSMVMTHSDDEILEVIENVFQSGQDGRSIWIEMLGEVEYIPTDQEVKFINCLGKASVEWTFDWISINDGKFKKGDYFNHILCFHFCYKVFADPGYKLVMRIIQSKK